MVDSPVAAACSRCPPCLLGQPASALGESTWQPSSSGSAEPWQAVGSSAVQSSGAAALEHTTVLLQLGSRHCYCFQVGHQLTVWLVQQNNKKVLRLPQHMGWKAISSDVIQSGACKQVNQTPAGGIAPASQWCSPACSQLTVQVHGCVHMHCVELLARLV